MVRYKPASGKVVLAHMMASGSVFQTRVRSNSRQLSTRLDADGNIVEVESREDEEQSVKLQETIDLLLAAGYFRARIKGLSNFDKVVGGMTWCVETCNFDVDVDLLFQENLTIGQKISLTEKIVAVLPKMKCPHRLEPHQIQGLDFIHIFPVVQWLVKKAIETREEMGDYIRFYSISQFNKTHRTPEDEAFFEQKERSLSTLAHIRETYKPRRQFRRQTALKLKDEKIQVQSTLLEYGRRYGLSRQTTTENEDGEEKDGSKQKEFEETRKAEEQVKELMSGMLETEEQEIKLTASVVGSIISMKSASLDGTPADFADKTELSSLEASGTMHHKRLASALTKQVAQRKSDLDETEKRHAELQEKYLEIKAQLEESQKYGEKLTQEMVTVEEMENEDNRGILQKLRSVVAMNESLKRQEREFKEHCKEEMGRLQTSIEELNSEEMEDETEDQERTQLVEKQYQSDKEKLHKIRLLLARKNREIATIQRRIDEVPSRAELSQYQRRFVELYNQVAAKHKETKQFYTLYNTLDDTKLYLTKEVNLLNSILDNFTEAMASVSTKEQFLKQFEQIVEGIKVNKAKLEKKKQEEKMRRDHLSDTYLDLVEKQRLYFKTVKDLKEECRKNELLLAKLKTHGQ